jgi:hypothetical protein
MARSQGLMDAKTRAEAIDKLKMYHGLPPHNGFNPCAGDGYFANSLVQKYGMSIAKLEKVSGFVKVKSKIGKLIAQAARIK